MSVSSGGLFYIVAMLHAVDEMLDYLGGLY